MSIKFPVDPTILWDRNPLIGHGFNGKQSIIVSYTDVCNYLVLLSSDLEKILETIINEEGGVHNIHAQLRHYSELTSDQRQVIEFSAYNSACRYPFYLKFSGEVENTFTSVTIPLKCINILDQLYSSAEERELLYNQLAKAIRFNRSFALKNFIRLRATGKAAKYVDTSESSTISYSGSLKVESTLPMFTIQCTPIQSIPILSSPLSSLLLSGNKDHHHLPIFGYLTLNQVRKLVFLQENDPGVSIVPTIGVWVRIETMDATVFPEIINELVYHPLSWAACLRFIQHDQLLRQHIINQNTFLLVILCQDRLQYFEVTPLVSSPAGPFVPINTIQDFPLVFANLDYTVNLNYEKNTSDSVQHSSYFEVNDLTKSVLCKFKMQSFPRVTNAPVSSKPLPNPIPAVHSPNVSNDYFLLREVLEGRNEVKHSLKQEEVVTVDTIDAPVPRELKQLPIPVKSPSKIPAPADPITESLQNIEKADVSQVYHHSSGNDTGLNQPPLVEVVISQSQEIEKLRTYIHTLRKIISDLGGEYPDMYVEEVNEDNVREEKGLQKASVAKEDGSINILETVDNNSNSEARKDQLKSEKQREIIPEEEEITSRYLSEDELISIRNIAELNLPLEAVEYPPQAEEPPTVDEPSHSSIHAEKVLTSNTSHASLPPSAGTTTTVLSRNSQQGNKSFPLRGSQQQIPEHATNFMEVPTGVFETESVIRIQSHYF